jgi:hypothetical protein
VARVAISHILKIRGRAYSYVNVEASLSECEAS